MFDAKYCESICIGLKVTLTNVPKNVTCVTLVSGYFYLIVNFNVTISHYII